MEAELDIFIKQGPVSLFVMSDLNVFLRHLSRASVVLPHTAGDENRSSQELTGTQK